MTEREKLSHVLRRFGLGAGTDELAKYEKLGLERTIDLLLHPEAVNEGFEVNPFAVATQQDGKLYRDPYQIGNWWAMRLLMTQTPLREKLTLFWHDHFAVSGDKVFEGITMLEYNKILRENGLGRFEDLALKVCKHGAMVSYLDANTSTRVHPNENFAREVFELFTLGIGNYSEQDVKEAARAFTGWSIHYGGLGDETPFEVMADRAAHQKMAVLNFCEVPNLHDEGQKTILGQKGNFDGDQVMKLVSNHPATKRHVCKKLWEFFVYSKPEPAVIDHLVKEWDKSNGEIRAVLLAITKLPEFYSEKAVRSMTKSPVDFTVGLVRCLGLRDILTKFATGSDKDFAPVSDDLRKIGNGIYYLLAQQGMTLLFPPNVGGWEWGTAWINSNNSMLRVRHSDLLFWGEDKNRPVAMLMAKRLENSQTAGDIVDGIAATFDIDLAKPERDMLIEACTKAGGREALNEKDRAANLFASITKLMIALPRFQLC